MENRTLFKAEEVRNIIMGTLTGLSMQAVAYAQIKENFESILNLDLDSTVSAFTCLSPVIQIKGIIAAMVDLFCGKNTFSELSVSSIDKIDDTVCRIFEETGIKSDVTILAKQLVKETFCIVFTEIGSNEQILKLFDEWENE